MGEAWEKMPRWKKDKILRERRASSTTPGTSISQPASADSSRKNSLVQAAQANSRKNSLAQAPQISSTPVENITTTSNGTEQQQEDSVKIDINAIWNESIEASKSPSPAVASSSPAVARVNGEDKFSEWLKQELQQAEQADDKRKESETSEAKVMALLAASESKQLKPPAPARRRKKTGQEEETEEAGAVRPNRRSRVG